MEKIPGASGLGPNVLIARARRIIPAHVSEVFSFVADATNDPSWIRPITHSRRLDDRPLGVGSRFEQRAAAGGRRARVVWEITEYENNRVFVTRSVAGEYTFVGGYEFSELDAGTVVTKFAEVERTGILFTVPRSLGSELMKRQFEAWLDRLSKLAWSPIGQGN